METDLFFVYGTLKVGGYFAKQFDDFRINTIEAEIEGYDLFDLGSFPGIKPGKGKVIGELHEYRDPEKVTRYMDSIEGYQPELRDGMYLRRRIPVKTITGDIKEANVYVFNLKIPEYSKKLKSGIWKLPKNNNKYYERT
jgi:gamma-glutamylcyclotransferase (GGCT)/AIG2-like uncharacterized protein YtfP